VGRRMLDRMCASVLPSMGCLKRLASVTRRQVTIGSQLLFAKPALENTPAESSYSSRSADRVALQTMVSISCPSPMEPMNEALKPHARRKHS
jgi:hypothetical protein